MENKNTESKSTKKRGWVDSANFVTTRRFDGDGDVAEWSFDPREIFPLGFDEFTDVQKNCIVNGLKQKLADCLARPKDMKLTPAEERDALTEMWGQLLEGNWNKKGSSVARGPSVGLKKLVENLANAGLSAEAIASATSKTLEQVLEFMPS